MASTILSSPSTPSSHHSHDHAFAHIPTNSSPLASSDGCGSSPTQSPSIHASERRRSQYKARGDIDSPTQNRRRASRRVTTGTIPFALSPNAQAGPSQEPTRTTMLRERFKARCIERANQDRERRINEKRRGLNLSSDGIDDLMDDEEDDGTVLDDPVLCRLLTEDILQFFQRIVANLKSKEKHSYRVSYAYDVGDSFDPDMENIDEWVNNTHEEVRTNVLPDEEELDDEELARLAVERELLEGLNMDEVFSYSDVEDYPTQDEDVEMD
ncbi:uncharacterized protein PHACADRAFT_160503 [Phanerochaete carnosa HHB-10118-sp]|uniref:Uncharacterized protein n=1 Tax=Phanerochaete carnosa (strain HHB-10118-sp) TaxID=650164 RepID=K5WCI3_PHACS|nr:uncharacterized protein PHACADRAFT_160503 [Phanerochaete carnosa HHB-10118-sp]EKM56950.1 hypothetical protein PHACADRAFT_160503 [Phanerochaete carnosa HHB-10118-sp]